MKLIALLLFHFSLSFQTQPYKYMNYQDIMNLNADITRSPVYKQIIDYYDLFEKYSIQRPSCPPDFQGFCRNFMYEITRFEKGEEFIYSRPVVLLMGGMHGNEIVGTNSLYQLVRIFLQYGLSEPQLQNLLNKVRLLIVPVINVEGYVNKRREEKVGDTLYDPNRDFPFNQIVQGKCLISTTAQIIDKIFRDYTVIATLTFHGGDNSISYPWGAFAHENDHFTGDNIAFKEVAEML